MASEFGADRTGEDLEQLCADTIRVLSMDGVQAANSGHPGMPMGMADVAHVLWTKHLNLDPTDPNWIARDRFVLSAGHGSMLLYSLLHLSGHGLELSDLKDFRQLHSKTPGHPESFETVGVETTTGPLGQGIGNAVGMALAERHLAARFPEAADALGHYTYTIVGDGDLQEGVSAEACSLAGHLGLSRLTVLYDDNQITIDGPTSLSFSEDVQKRYAAYGWHTQQVDGHDLAAVSEAIEAARAETSRPSLIACRTIIGKGSPNKQNSSGVHGSPLGPEELKLTKQGMGWPQDAFLIPNAVKTRWAERQAEWAKARQAWNGKWSGLDGETTGTIAAWFKGGAPDLSKVEWPTFEAGGTLATRASSGQVINAIALAVPNLIGGSADLSPSNKTEIKGSPNFSKEDYAGRNLRFGVREHAMGAIMNGISLHGGLIAYGGTFLVFADYVRPAIRLAALMRTRAIYVMTHDSIFVGEDGPTHQPVEQIASLRAIPRVRVIRPADAAETAVAWRMALEYDGPTVLSLTRQNLPTIDRSTHAEADGALRGGYVLWERGGNPDVTLIATGSEVQLALDVAQTLVESDGKAVRVVSLPCWKVFDAQDQGYQDSVIPPRCGARISLEAGATFGWTRYTGDLGLRIGIDTFGASAPASALAEYFELSPGQVLEKVRDYLSASTLT